MSEVGQCELYCPRKAHKEAVLREDMARKGALGKLGLAGASLIHAVELLARAAVCPQANAPAEDWRPSQGCADDVRSYMAERPLDSSGFSDYQHQVLDPYIDPTPPSFEK